MNVGDRIAVGPLLVWKVEAAEWAVFTPDNEPTVVVEDAAAPFGLDGADFAVRAVLDAEQTGDAAAVEQAHGPAVAPW